MQKKVLFTCLIAFLVSCKEASFSERYRLPWREPNNNELRNIGIALVNSDIRVCGEYYVRESSLGQGEYVVGCTADGTNFNYFIVWPLTKKVMSISSTEVDEPPIKK
jgi:hypothetical protein